MKTLYGMLGGNPSMFRFFNKRFKRRRVYCIRGSVGKEGKLF